ncbi:MAG: hypothetical protein JWP12_1606 [Bacteroidetes bacterium]|nr:hypothetical protein [Bacteroidota bacterium]
MVKNNLETIIRGLEDEIIMHLDEAERLKKALAIIKGDSEVPQTEEKGNGGPATNPDWPNYPFNESILDKLRYIEDKDHSIWRKRDIEDIIEKIEGKRAAAKTLKNLAQKMVKLIKEKKLVNLKMNNSNLYSFYTTRHEWIEQESDGKKVGYRILPGHEPAEDILKNLTEEQKRPENYSVSGF